METTGAAANDPNPEFTKKFQETIQAYADSTEAGKDDEAQMAALSALLMAAEEGIKNPTPELILKQKADDLENQCEWVEAEKVRREILSMEENMEEKTGKCALIAKAQMDLSRLLRTCGRIDESLVVAREAIASARRADFSSLIATTLQSAAFCALEAGDPKGALALACEAVDIIEPGKIRETTKTRALATRARFRLANGDIAGAAQDLEQGRDRKWEKWAGCGLPGPAFALANWWETKSELERQQGNFDAAREALKQAIDGRRHFDSPHAKLSLAKNLENLAELCHRAGEFENAKSALEEADTIRRNLKLPSGPIK